MNREDHEDSSTYPYQRNVIYDKLGIPCLNGRGHRDGKVLVRRLPHGVTVELGIVRSVVKDVPQNCVRRANACCVVT
jgi:hypothetical protein